nr:MAG: hypothetical protein DIU55_12775 [Bacillota bacterium]
MNVSQSPDVSVPRPLALRQDPADVTHQAGITVGVLWLLAAITLVRYGSTWASSSKTKVVSRQLV